jgi:glycosyltransferase involved in cell wall biosynthesis
MDLGNLVSVCARRWAGHHVVTVLTVHVDPKAMSVYEPPRGPARLSIPLIRWLYPKADAIVAVSRGVGDSLAVVTGIPRERIHVIHNPLVSAELTADAEHSPGHPWFDKPRLPVVLGVGRLVPQKDFDTLIRAFALVRQQARGRLLILGEGPERPRLMALISALGLESEVELLGFTGNPYAYMRRARLVVLSSTFEGFGNVLVEAMACGTPVVSTDCPSGPAEILEQGRYGPLVPVGDPVALAAAMVNVLHGPIDRRALLDRSQAFSIERIAGQYLDLVEGLRQPGRPG